MNWQLCATPRTAQSWQEIDFKAAERSVKKLQMRIAKAVKEKKWGKVKALQWTLTHSFYAKALAVKQVTENQGKRTSGGDGRNSLDHLRRKNFLPEAKTGIQHDREDFV